MKKRIQFGILVFGCVSSGWLIGQMTTGSAAAQTQAGASVAPSLAKYSLHSIYIGDTWELWRLNDKTGEAWHEVDNNKLVKIKDATQLPEGDYDLRLITNGKSYTGHRIDRRSGRVWQVNGSEWSELLSAK